MNVFDNREAQAMLIADLKDPFDSEDYLYELKFDGIRLLAYIDENKTDLRKKSLWNKKPKRFFCISVIK